MVTIKKLDAIDNTFMRRPDVRHQPPANGHWSMTTVAMAKGVCKRVKHRLVATRKKENKLEGFLRPKGRSIEQKMVPLNTKASTKVIPRKITSMVFSI